MWLFNRVNWRWLWLCSSKIVSLQESKKKTKSPVNKAEKASLLHKSRSGEHCEGKGICSIHCSQSIPAWTGLHSLYFILAMEGDWLAASLLFAGPNVPSATPTPSAGKCTSYPVSLYLRALSPQTPVSRQTEHWRCSGSWLKASVCLKITCPLPEKASIPC